MVYVRPPVRTRHDVDVEFADLFTIPPAGRATSNRAALQEVVDKLKPRSKADVELARDVVKTIFERGVMRPRHSENRCVLPVRPGSAV